MDDLLESSAHAVFHPTYGIPVLIGILIMLVFPITKDICDPELKRSYYKIQLVTLFGAIVGSKLSVLVGDALWPIRSFNHWEQLLYSGRSITGALILGFIAAEIAKPIMRYRLPPNDRFAVVLPISLGIGRIGCFLTGCCRGTPYDGMFAIAYDDHIHRHPAQLYEAGFHFAVAAFLYYLYRKGILRERLFVLYLACYGAYRFFSEYIRETEKAFAGYSAYQLFAVMMIIIGLAALYRRSRQIPIIMEKAV